MFKVPSMKEGDLGISRAPFMTLHYRVDVNEGVLNMLVQRSSVHNSGKGWSGWFGVGFVDEEANGVMHALVLAFLPVWIVGMNGYSLVDHGVAVYNASIVDGTTQMMYSGQPGLGGILPDYGTLLKQDYDWETGVKRTPIVDSLCGGAECAWVRIKLKEAGGSYPVTAMKYMKLVFLNSIFDDYAIRPTRDVCGDATATAVGWETSTPTADCCDAETAKKYECTNVRLTPLTHPAVSTTLLFSTDGSRTACTPPSPPPSPPAPPKSHSATRCDASSSTNARTGAAVREVPFGREAP